ncbi:MAG: hypothetical protein K8T25_24075 [Planctomycetia bacterium]|nr:hypothetical protein [Planctomycetia bacterium]
MMIPLVTLIFSAVAIVILLRAGRALQGTTLTGPWLWAILAMVAVGLSELVIVGPGRWQASATLVRYAAGVATLCPAVALLGARRPQHAAWQFVVATLYVILLVPAVQTQHHGGAAAALEAPWSWFVAGLIGLGLVCGLGTRYLPSAIALGLAQLVMLGPFLVGTAAFEHWLPARTVTTELGAGAGSLIGAGLLTLAAGLVRWRVSRKIPPTSAGGPALPISRIWLDFRDTFGTLWALRVQQRLNASAAMYQWPIVLRWDGFYDATGRDKLTRMPPELAAAVEHALRSLLWRFVSPQWIDERLNQ